MATSRDNLFNKLSGSYWNAGVTFQRTNPVPLEKYSVFATKAEADAYALTNVVAYPGQPVAVVDEDGTKLYYIDNDGTLKSLATGGDAGELEAKLNNEISARTTDVTKLSSEISTINETTLPTLSSTLSADLSVTVEKLDTPESGFEATYVVKQGGTQVGANINIPKDKVISSAYVVDVKGISSTTEPIELTAFEVYYDGALQKTVTKDDTTGLYDAIHQAYTGTGGGDGKYLRITVTNAEALPIYIALPELVDTYVGAETDTVKVTVNSDTRAISADVKTGSIAESMLCADLTAKIENVITSDADVRATVEEISGTGEKSFKYADAQLSNSLTALLSGVSSDIESDITTETTRAQAAEAYLSTAVDNKISVDGQLADIGVMHLSRDEYHEMVKAGTVLSNVIYIVSSDNLNMYGEKITNLADGADLSDAVNFKQLSSVSADLKTDIDTAVKEGVEALSAKVFGDDGLSAELKTAIADETTRATAAEQFLSGKIDIINGDGAGSISAATNIAISTAKSYTDSVSALLSADYTAKDGETYTSAVSTAKSYTDSVSALLSADYVQKISDAEDTALSDAKAYTNEVSALVKADYEKADGETYTSAVSTAKSYTDSVSSLLSTDYTAKDGETYTSAVSTAKSYTDSVSALLSADYIAKDGETYTSAVSTAKSYTDSVSAELSTDYVGKIKNVDDRVTTIYNTTGLSAATSDNVVVTWSTISDLVGSGMHFRGVTTEELSTGSTVVPVPPYAEGDVPKSGDIVINQGTSKEFIWVTTSTTSSWCELGDEVLYLKKADFDAWKADTYAPTITTLSNSISAVSSDVASLKTISADLDSRITTVSTDLSSEETRAKDVESKLSTAIHDKVVVGDYGSTLSAVDSLSVVHISQDAYHNLVVTSALNPETIYVVSSDSLNMYGEKITNLAEPTLSGDATTKNYVDTTVNDVSVALSSDYVSKIDAAKKEIVGNALSGVTINDVKATVTGNVAVLDISCIMCGGAETGD